MKALSIDTSDQIKILGLSKNPLNNEFLFVKTIDAIHVVEKKSIRYLQAQGNYTLIYTVDRKICSSKTLKHFEQILKGRSFIRSHQSYLVNIFHVDKFSYGSSSRLILLSGKTIPVSRSKKSAILCSFNN